MYTLNSSLAGISRSRHIIEPCMCVRAGSNASVDAVEALALDLHLQVHVAQVEHILRLRSGRDVLVRDVQHPFNGAGLQRKAKGQSDSNVK